MHELKLAALDPEDLQVVSACVQDAVTRVVYRAVVEAPDVVEIFAVDVSDGVADPPAKVSAELAAGEVIGGQLRSTDRWLVYGGFSPDTSSSELYVVDLRAPTPGAAFRVTDAPVPALGTVVGDIEFSPDGSLLAFSHHGPSAGVTIVTALAIRLART